MTDFFLAIPHTLPAVPHPLQQCHTPSSSAPPPPVVPRPLLWCQERTSVQSKVRAPSRSAQRAVKSASTASCRAGWAPPRCRGWSRFRYQTKPQRSSSNSRLSRKRGSSTGVLLVTGLEREDCHASPPPPVPPSPPPPVTPSPPSPHTGRTRAQPEWCTKT